NKLCKRPACAAHSQYCPKLLIGLRYGTQKTKTPTTMPNNIAVTAQTITRHALNIAFVYLLICGLPVALMFITAGLPDDQIRHLAEDPLWGQVLRFFYPVLPIQTTHLPFGFQDSLAVLP